MGTKEPPEDVELEEMERFLTPRFVAGERVLEVGCGRGHFARRLAEEGFQVTALDISLERTERTAGVRYVEADFLAFEDAPYDALVFVASLHHLYPLDAALRASRRLLRPGGRILASDFDVNAPDLTTARWYYDVEGLLLQGGLFRPEKVHAAEVENALDRWHQEHLHTPPFHTGAAMREGLEKHFTEVGSVPLPFLYRHLARGLKHGPNRAAVASWVFATENRHVASGFLKAVGLGLWAQTPVERSR